MTLRSLVFIVFMLLPCVASADPQPDRIIPYKKIGEVTLQLHIFNPPAHTPSDRRPAVIFFFGGGWLAGTPTQFYRQSAYLASRGMVAIAAEYRVKNRHNTSPKEAVKDGKSAMRWVRANADKLGVNPLMIAAGGGSAGGHVAAATATLKDFNEEGEDSTVSARPNALLLFNPVFDNGPDGYGYDRVKAYWEKISPLHNLGPSVPPTIVLLGTKDKFIPVSTAQAYKKKMESLGVRCDLHLYQGQPHAFFNRIKYTETLLAVDNFLISLGYLKDPPTITQTTKKTKHQ